MSCVSFVAYNAFSPLAFLSLLFAFLWFCGTYSDASSEAGVDTYAYDIVRSDILVFGARESGLARHPRQLARSLALATPSTDLRTRQRADDSRQSFFRPRTSFCSRSCLCYAMLSLFDRWKSVGFSAGNLRKCPRRELQAAAALSCCCCCTHPAFTHALKLSRATSTPRPSCTSACVRVLPPRSGRIPLYIPRNVDPPHSPSLSVIDSTRTCKGCLR